MIYLLTSSGEAERTELFTLTTARKHHLPPLSRETEGLVLEREHYYYCSINYNWAINPNLWPCGGGMYTQLQWKAQAGADCHHGNHVDR